MPLPITTYAAHLRAEREAFNRQRAAEGLAPRPIPAARPARLLLLGCSATKDPAPGLLPARARYRGPLWLTLGAADRAGERAQVVAVSAAFGFVAEWQEIPDYEARLSPRAGAELAARIALPAGGTIPRGAAADSALAALHDAAVKAERPLEEIALCGGAAYLAPMRAAVAAAIARGWIAPGARVVEINGTIGRMRQALRAWIEGRALAAPAAVAGDVAPAVTPAAAPPASPATSPAPVTPAEEPPHLAGLRAALARVEAQRAELVEGAERTAWRGLHDWRRAQPDSSRAWSPSAILRSETKRREVDARLGELRHAATERRAAQLVHLARKARRIRQAIAEAEERLRRRQAEEAARRRHNGGPALAPEEAARPAAPLRAPSPPPPAPAPLRPFLARPRGMSPATSPHPSPHPAARLPARGATEEIPA